MREWVALHQILEVYEKAFGQQLNRDKTSLVFSWNTKPAAKAYLMEVARLLATMKMEKYLGLPSLIGRSRAATFKGIVDRVGQKLGNWKNQFLSQAMKEILFKAVLQAIPTYYMSVFLLPLSLCRKLILYLLTFGGTTKTLNTKSIGKAITY
ncbi:uncharacterized protein LOC121247368 [Juglans microcarpa x Juglans regia]|uniref:uncharacterized protein LOC121247368 n=1 Tax=Juglans microcarpa x Juglans regia TaxID=2249226 RepID=UPI001B7E3A16|nr:uncharacterized protein LOC121247368 [Juglans microcarpa x Juglans regia]